jgi:hypothetical protein
MQLAGEFKKIRTNTIKTREMVQEALISCAFYAWKDGQVTPFNQLLDAVGTSTHVKGLTMWAEVWGCVLVKDEAFVLNKTARKERAISDYSDFESFEAEMRAAPKWFEMAPKQKVESMFDASTYLDGVMKKLEKEGASTALDFVTKAVTEYKKADALIKLALEDAPL